MRRIGVGVGLISLCLAAGFVASAQNAQPVRLTFWHYFTDRAQLFEEFAGQYQALTGVQVKMELYSGDTLGQKFQAAAQAGTLPDLSAAWIGIGQGTAPYASKGIILNLNPQMKAGWSKFFTAEQLKAGSFVVGNPFGVTPGAYLVPLDSNNMQFLYNKTLFKKAGITSTPKTFEQLLADGEKLNKIGAAPLVSGFGSWGTAAFNQPYMWNIIGSADLERTFSGKMPYSSEPWIKLLGLYKTIGGSNLFGKGSLAADFPAAENLFLNGQAGMIFDGSWAIGVFNQQNPNFKDYGVFFPPRISGSKYPVYIPGGVGSLAFVVGTSPNAKEAAKFLQWLTEPKQQAKYATASFNLPANVSVAKSIPLTENLTAFASRMKLTVPTLKHTMKPAVETTMVAGIQRILEGRDTPENVTRLMDQAHKTDKAQ